MHRDKQIAIRKGVEPVPVNQVAITGNLTRDPEVRSTAGGLAVMAFSVAVNERVKNQQTGEWEDRPNFIDCKMFGTRAESVSRYLSKGSKVAVSGRLRWSQWEKDGQRRSKLEVVADDIEFLSARGEAKPTAQTDAQPSYYDEDIPF